MNAGYSAEHDDIDISDWSKDLWVWGGSQQVCTVSYILQCHSTVKDFDFADEQYSGQYQGYPCSFENLMWCDSTEQRLPLSSTPPTHASESNRLREALALSMVHLACKCLALWFCSEVLALWTGKSTGHFQEAEKAVRQQEGRPCLRRLVTQPHLPLGKMAGVVSCKFQGLSGGTDSRGGV